MTRTITLKIQLKFCGTSGSQALMHLRSLAYICARIQTLALTRQIYCANCAMHCAPHGPNLSEVVCANPSSLTGLYLKHKYICCCLYSL